MSGVPTYKSVETRRPTEAKIDGLTATMRGLKADFVLTRWMLSIILALEIATLVKMFMD